MKKILFILSFVLYSFTHAQTHEWAEPFVPITINQFNFVQIKALAIDSKNNSFVVGIYNSDFTINNDTIPLKSNYFNGVNNCVAKFNSSGNFKWVKTQYLYTINSSNTSSPPAYFSNINIISDNKILVHGFFYRGGFSNESNVSAVLKLSDTDSIINSSSSSLNAVGFYVIYDSTGNIVKYNKVFEGNISSSIWNGQLAIDEQKNIYVLVKGTSGTVYSDKVNTNLNFSTFNAVLIKFTADFDSIAWYKTIATHTGTNYYITSRIRIGLNDNNIYLASLIRMESSGTITIDSIEYAQYLPNNFTKGLLTILSPSGNFIHNGFINADLSQQDNAFDVIAFDTSRIYITGHVQDSILYGGQWFTSTGSPSSNIAYPYIAKISVTKADWIRLSQEKTEHRNTAFFYGGFNNRINIDKKGYVYSYFEYHNNILSMGGLTDSGSQGRMGFVKLDSLGNALWLRLGVAVTDMQVDTRSDLVYCGNYSSGTLFLNPFTLPFAQRNSGFIAKITDYTITRGEVSSGPYCAGDAFFVPYAKMGEYDIANFFIAELSDENGNFEGGERELGRIKTVEDSTITGQLPLFQVASSPNYRIRVRSTHPP
jgi:hypothetical protein